MRLRDIWPWLRAEFRWRVLGKRYEIILTEETQRQLTELPEDRRAKVIEAMERIARRARTSAGNSAATSLDQEA